MSKQVKCRSGLPGWQDSLHNNYGGDQGLWLRYCEIYHLHLKLGYTDPKEAWDGNPTIQGSTDPDDYCCIINGHRLFFDCRTGEPIEELSP